ncbi:M20 family metallopeptidase [Lutibaculum baratangense]|uniref:Catalyzes the cleavage of p-aminobenzoyl-glutamate to p-aminobenzoate and glutamate, subunit B n=1 Tax=Lutibaculum baratangense AMV1 TaxID=631454 RepID=V4RJR8_9HYPH|nr:M20 family metallopeptidase [Lutibaculum baratangense]ESR25569.1 Catalyzes the cleavage of p-aminobenzoyl-glutamate to p-aminobenzoate and glutamate, subunit B [Lutibaculum baratangense AMV1]
MSNSERIWDLVDARREAYEALSDRIWGMPEIAYTEYRSSAEHKAMLEEEGFRVTDAPAGIPTAVMGEAGEGGPIIAFLGEYDALPGLSQEANVAEPRPLPGNGHGHGCGHNMLGSAALLAATAFKNYLAETGRPGRMRYYGCPAEEGGAAKAFMVRDGAFEGVDCAITWHPASLTRVDEALSLANTRIDFTFKGRASHAAAAPHLGRSALDAVELMNVGVNYMREHMPSSARIHYAMIDAGGIAPNVVQGRATVRYAVRALDIHAMKALNERVMKVARGAALMTETEVEWRILSAVSNLLGNTPMEETMQLNMDRLGPVVFDDSDREFAAAIQATLTEEDIVSDYRRCGVEPQENQPLCDFIVPLGQIGEPMIGSTDVGDVSWAVPTVQARVATHAIGTPGHSWQITAQGKGGPAYKGLVYAAKVMAGTAVDLLNEPDRLEAAKADHAARTTKTPYVCPIPPEVNAPIQPKPADL